MPQPLSVKLCKRKNTDPKMDFLHSLAIVSKLFKKIPCQKSFIDLTGSDLSCSMQDLPCVLWNLLFLL